jgi:hypothetical protein
MTQQQQRDLDLSDRGSRLARKVLPDLASVEHSGTRNKPAREMTDEQIAARLAELSGSSDDDPKSNSTQVLVEA